MLHLKFDPAEIASIADGGHNVGAYLRAGDDGTLLGHDGDSLKVKVTNSLAIDVDLDHADDSVRLGDGTNLVTVTNVASDYGLDVNLINASIAVTATDLDIRDLSQGTDSIDSWLFDGSGNAVGSTGGALDIAIDAINITGGLPVNDGLATALKNTATPVSTTGVAVVASALADRKELAYANEGNKSIYFGMETGLTADNGFPCHPGMQHFWKIGAALSPKFIGESGASSEDVRVLEGS